MTRQWARRVSSRTIWFWLSLIVLGYVARIAVWLVSEGSNDIRTWRSFAKLVHEGLGQAYVRDGLMNHPPLTALWGELASQHLVGAPWTFAQLFKLPSLLAEVGTGFLIFASWRARGETMAGVRAAAGYALALSPILISAYHGNTDAVYFFFVLAAAYLMENKSPFWAGLALSAALNVKLIPIVFALPLASRCRTWPSLAKYALGGGLGMLPFAVAYFDFAAAERTAFIGNVFGYHSFPNEWGIELVVRSLSSMTARPLPSFSTDVRHAGDWYLLHGGKLLVGGSALFALWHVWPGRRRFNSYELASLTFLAFMIFASGFGVQYVGCVVAPLFACWAFGGVVASTTTGVLISAIYLTFISSWRPVYSHHDFAVPEVLSGVIMVTWLVLIALLVKVATRRGTARQRLFGGRVGSFVMGSEVSPEPHTENASTIRSWSAGL